MNNIDAERELLKMVDVEFKKDFDKLLAKMICMETIRIIVSDALKKYIKDVDSKYEIVSNTTDFQNMIDKNEISFVLIEKRPVENIKLSFTIDKDGNMGDIIVK